MPVLVRPIQPGDAAAYWALLAWLDNESRYPVVNLIERSLSVDDWRSAIEQLHAAGERMIFVAALGPQTSSSAPSPGAQTSSSAPSVPPEGADEDVCAPGEGADEDVCAPRELVGFLSTTSDWSGIQELRIVIGIREQYTGQGIGTQLFTALEQWARAAGVRRLHLTVETDNARALALYHKMGFTITGHIPRAIQIKGEWVDDYVMEKILSQALS